MGRLGVFFSILPLIVTTTTWAQSRNQESTTGELQRQLDEMRSQIATMQNRIAELEAAKGSAATPSTDVGGSQPEAKSTEGPSSIHFKALDLTPGGFLESTILVRTRNENADIANTYSAIPLDGSSVETDFLGAAPTANYVQSSSWTPRLRQLWVQFGRSSGWTVTAGQMWSLLTTNRQGIETLEELRPVGADGQYVVGFTRTREKAVRVTKNFNDKIWAAFAVENPESTFSAAFVSPNVMGLNTSQNAATGVNLLPFLENYSNGQSTTLAPDLLTKVAFEPAVKFGFGDKTQLQGSLLEREKPPTRGGYPPLSQR